MKGTIDSFMRLYSFVFINKEFFPTIVFLQAV